MNPNDDQSSSEPNGSKSFNGLNGGGLNGGGANGGSVNGGAFNGAGNGTGNGAGNGNHTAGNHPGNFARLPGQVGSSMHPGHSSVAHTAVAHSTDGLVQILGRRWGIIVAVTILAILGGVAYLTVAKKIYTSTAELRVGEFDPQQLASSTSTHGDTEAANDFLQTQCVGNQIDRRDDAGAGQGADH